MTYLSKLNKLLDSGVFTVTTEISPPKHASVQGIMEVAAAQRDYVDAANITDCQAAVVRLSSIAAGAHMLKCGVEPVIQMTCRDRNRIAIQSDLLGAYSLGMRNLLCLSGDHQKFGNHKQSKNVYDIDSIQLIQLVRRMRDEKRFFSGEEIKGNAPEFYIGAVANPSADPFEFRVDRLEKKVEAGAEFIQTQAIFDLERFERFMEMVRARGIDRRTHILAGIVPLKSWKGAEYVRTKVPGMLVPDEVAERLKTAADQKQAGIDLAVEQIKYIRDKIKGVHGIHIMAIAWEDAVPGIISRAGLFPRPQPAN